MVGGHPPYPKWVGQYLAQFQSQFPSMFTFVFITSGVS